MVQGAGLIVIIFINYQMDQLMKDAEEAVAA